MRILRLGLVLRKTIARSFWALIDRRVPGRLKLLAVAATLFVLSPLNLLGDIPILGAIDDAALLMLVLTWFTRASSPYQNTIDDGRLWAPSASLGPAVDAQSRSAVRANSRSVR